MHRLLPILMMAAVLMFSGCSVAGRTLDDGRYTTINVDPDRNTELAQAENTKALELIAAGDYQEAQVVLKRALAADVTFGPAHNNLGTVYFHLSKFYLAAWEFEYACKLMPHHAEPRTNLGLVFEAVGQYGQAALWHDKAVGLEPENPQMIGNLVRAQLQRGERGVGVQQLLADLILRDDRPDWVKWARRKLALIRD